jgi:hypothetical protein
LSTKGRESKSAKVEKTTKSSDSLNQIELVATPQGLMVSVYVDAPCAARAFSPRSAWLVFQTDSWDEKGREKSAKLEKMRQESAVGSEGCLPTVSV